MNRRILRYFSLPLAIIALLFALDVFCLNPVGQPLAGLFPPFRASSLQGQTYDEGIFSGHLSLVCLWVARDNASAQLLEELSSWQQEENSSLQLVGLAGDIKEDAPAEMISQAKTLTQDLPPSFPQLLVNDSLAPFLATIKTAPAFVFIDKEGKFTGQPIAGFELELIKKEARRLVSADSLEVKTKNYLQSTLLR